MIEALKRLGVALALAADLGAAVRAGVEKRAKRSLGIAGEQDAAASDSPAQEVARLGQLGGVAEIKPRALENELLFRLEYFGVGEVAPRDLEDLLGGIDQ